MVLTPVDLLPRLAALVEVARENRVIVGIVGPPGAGKTTLASWVLAQLDETLPGAAAWVPMDGFHLADAELDRLGRRERKGAADTFDAFGYLATLRRIRADTADIVYAPAFDRTLEQPIAGAMAVPSTARLIVTEGNYLLDADEPWPAIRAELDEVWFCEVSDELRRQRLVERHITFGKSPEAAASWVDAVDEPNARRVVARASFADLQVDTAGG